MSKKKADSYRQCHLKRDIETGTVQQTSWIPSKFAKLGKVLDLKGDDDEWTHDWKVMSVSSVEVEDPPDWRKAVRSHRKATGDSSPKS